MTRASQQQAQHPAGLQASGLTVGVGARACCALAAEHIASLHVCHWLVMAVGLVQTWPPLQGAESESHLAGALPSSPTCRPPWSNSKHPS